MVTKKFLWYTLEWDNPWNRYFKSKSPEPDKQGFIIRLYERCICNKHNWIIFDYTKHYKHKHLHILGFTLYNNGNY